MRAVDLHYFIAIDMIPGIGSINAKRLIAYCGGAEAVFKEKKAALLKIPGIGDTLAKEIAHQNVLQRAEAELTFIDRYGIGAYTFLDKDYPDRLKACEDGPVVLFSKGEVNFNERKVLAVVGTRNATDYGKSLCEHIVAEIVSLGHTPIIVSGLAFGIDICAHRAALKNSLKTVAVLGHSLNTIYPSEHKNTAREIVSNGALVSDFPSETKTDRQNFIKRNRIIAGLSDITLVVESGAKGGALITADLANSYSRDVAAIPGRSGDKYSEGCNNLIKTNRAALVESAKDIQELMGWEPETGVVKHAIQSTLFVELSEQDKVIVELLGATEKESLDILALRAQMPVSKVSAILLNLEFAGIVRSLPGKQYSLTRR